MSDRPKRPLNDFIHCTCGIVFISGYTHCPKCGKVNQKDKTKTNKRLAGSY